MLQPEAGGAGVGLRGRRGAWLPSGAVTLTAGFCHHSQLVCPCRRGAGGGAGAGGTGGGRGGGRDSGVGHLAVSGAAAIWGQGLVSPRALPVPTRPLLSRLVIRFRAAHLESLTLVTSTKTFSTNEVTVTGLRGRSSAPALTIF